VPVAGQIRVASADGVVACAKAGLGIALASRWMCRAELEAGERRPSLKVRAFADYFAASLAE
jgi:DNA-binding transcriptional LysR family regulator